MSNNDIIIVSGLPRSGTSMVMKMLAAGGVDVLTDNIRQADEDNPKGYYEYEKVKQLNQDNTWLAEMKGRGVKIISHLLYRLPPTLEYKIVFIRRDMTEILASQRKMYTRLQAVPDDLDDAILARKFNHHLSKITAWLRQQPNMALLYVNHQRILTDPTAQAGRIRDFLGKPLDIPAMATVVDPRLYRNRKPST